VRGTDGRFHLAYELVLTNVTPMSIGIDRIDVLDSDTHRVLLSLAGSMLPANMNPLAGLPPGAPPDAATRAKWTTLLQRLREHPVTFDDVTFTHAVLVSAMWAWLTTTELQPGFIGWTAAAGVLQDLWERSNTDGALTAAKPAAAASFTTGREAAGRRASAGLVQPYAGPEQGLAVLCADSPNPRHPLAFLALDALAYARASDIGLPWVWNDEPCASWPATAADRYTGPWDRPTASPILVIGNTVDPEPPYEGAVAMAGYLARARALSTYCGSR
jgi:hypothetical protein